MIIAIFNIVVAVLVVSLIFTMTRVHYKYESYFGDDDKRTPLQYTFLRLLVLTIVLSLIAAVVNIATFV